MAVALEFCYTDDVMRGLIIYVMAGILFEYYLYLAPLPFCSVAVMKHQIKQRWAYDWFSMTRRQARVGAAGRCRERRGGSAAALASAGSGRRARAVTGRSCRSLTGLGRNGVRGRRGTRRRRDAPRGAAAGPALSPLLAGGVQRPSNGAVARSQVQPSCVSGLRPGTFGSMVVLLDEGSRFLFLRF